MHVSAVRAVWFSPTGTTEQAASAVARTLAEELGVPTDGRSLTVPPARERVYLFPETDLVVAACPTYAGRLPNKIAPDLRRILRTENRGALAVPLVTFGNRAFDNSLAELCSLLSGNGFRVVSAAAFVCRHAFTDNLGSGRPDWDDRQAMEAFAGGTAEKVRRLSADGPILPPDIPGNPDAPYYVPRGLDGEPARFLKAKPRTDLSRCSRCGACVRRCPMGAIDPAAPWEVPGVCIKCQACVRVCTRRAKSFEDPAFLSHVAMISHSFPEPKENRVFL